MTKFCTKCGAPYNSGAKFCTKCGTRFLNDVENSNNLSKIIETAKKFNVWRYPYKKLVKALPDVLEKDEKIERLSGGISEDSHFNVLIVVTDERVILVGRRLLSSMVQDFPYDTISSAKEKKGLLTGSITNTHGKKTKIDMIVKDDVDKLTRMIRSKLKDRRSKKDFRIKFPN